MGKGRVYQPSGGDKLTQQHFGDSTDINRIMEKFNRTGVLGTGAKQSGRKPIYLNLSGESYHEMLLRIQEAQGQFANFPAKVRKRFANNPENLLRFLGDDKNLAEAAELGLVDLDSIPAERKAQLDLVDEADKLDFHEFLRWKNRRRQAANDDPFSDANAKPMPTQSDDEAQPRKSSKNRTS